MKYLAIIIFSFIFLFSCEVKDPDLEQPKVQIFTNDPSTTPPNNPATPPENPVAATPEVSTEASFTLTQYPFHFYLQENDRLAIKGLDEQFLSLDLLQDFNLAVDTNYRMQDIYYPVIDSVNNQVTIFRRKDNSQFMILDTGHNPQDAVLFYNYLFIANTNDREIGIVSFINLD